MKRPTSIVHQPRGGALGPRLHLAFERAAQAVIAAKRSPHTKSAYTQDLGLWLTFCDEEGVDPSMATLEDSTAFRDELVLEGAKATVIRRLAAMSSVYRALHKGAAVRSNPFHPAMLAWPTGNMLPKTRLVTDEHALAMIDHAMADKRAEIGVRDAAILRLLYDTGLRRVSVAQIERKTYVDGCIQAVVKGSKEVELELPQTCRAAIDRWLAVAPSSDHLFPGYDGSHLNVATINKIVKLRARAIGAPHVHPHSFRAAFVTAAYDAGLPEHEIQASVHHSDPKTTRRYDRKVRGRAVASAVEKFRNK